MAAKKDEGSTIANSAFTGMDGEIELYYAVGKEAKNRTLGKSR